MHIYSASAAPMITRDIYTHAYSIQSQYQNSGLSGIWMGLYNMPLRFCPAGYCSQLQVVCRVLVDRHEKTKQLKLRVSICVEHDAMQTPFFISFLLSFFLSSFLSFLRILIDSTRLTDWLTHTIWLICINILLYCIYYIRLLFSLSFLATLHNTQYQ